MAITKISSCRENKTSRRGIKQLETSFGSILFFFYFPMKVAGGHVHISRGNPGPRLLPQAGRITLFCLQMWGLWVLWPSLD